jgi:hypothetical protein
MAFFLTNNGRDSAGATHAAGIRLTGLDLKDGSFAYGTATDQVSSRGFSFYRGYPVNPPGTRSISSGELTLLASGIPDGASALDLTGGGTISHLVFATLTGELYKVDATVTGTFSSMIAPLAAFTGNYHPIGSTPTIYRDAAGDFHAVVVSGGYADPVSTAWSPASTRQFLVSVELEHTGSTIAIPDAAGDSNSLGIAGADFRIDLGLGNRAYASATRVGDQIFVTTQDSTVDVNASTYGGTSGGGLVRQVSLSGVQQGSGMAVSGGANSVSRVGASVYVAGTDQVHNVTATTSIGAGLTSEIVADIKKARKLWLRLE